MTIASAPPDVSRARRRSISAEKPEKVKTKDEMQTLSKLVFCFLQVRENGIGKNFNVVNFKQASMDSYYMRACCIVQE